MNRNYDVITFNLRRLRVGNFADSINIAAALKDLDL